MKTNKFLIIGAAFVLMISCDTNSVSINGYQGSMSSHEIGKGTIHEHFRDVPQGMLPTNIKVTKDNRKAYS